MTAAARTAQEWWAWARHITRPIIAASIAVAVVCGVASSFTVRAETVSAVLGVLTVVAVGVLVLATVTHWTARAAGWWLLGDARWQTFSPRARRARMTAVFDRAWHDQSHDRKLVRITGVYQRGRRGTKCYIEHPFGYRQEAWFWHTVPRRGDVYLVRCSSGWGQHRSLLDLLYVGSDTTGPGIIYRLPAAAWKAAARQARGR